jgi:cell division protein FtsI (penicillin-binding protein 3)
MAATAEPVSEAGGPPRDVRRGPSPRLKSAALRAMIVGIAVTCLFVAVSAQLVRLGMRGQDLQRAAPAEVTLEFYSRPNIVDRRGQLLAADIGLPTLFADPFLILSVDETVEQLAAFFPELDNRQVRSALGDPGKRYFPLKRAVAPMVAQKIHDLGLPGIAFKDEPKRSYPAGRLAGHVLGHVNGNNYGVAGIERILNDNDGVRRVHAASVNTAPPLRLTIDVLAQYALEQELAAAIARNNASAATGILLDVDSGEIHAAVSLPGVDPSIAAEVLDKARRNRFADDAFELGSIFKVFTIAMALDMKVVSPRALVDVSTPLEVGRFKITDDHPVKAKLSLEQILVRSSNIGAGALAQAAGADRQRTFLARLGLTQPIGTPDVRSVAPVLPGHWGETETVTISYGHGIAVSPLQFAVAFASIVNGGFAVTPTFLHDPQRRPQPRRRVVTPATSKALQEMLRENVLRGTGRRARAAGYRVGGKTGTADLARGGRYDGASVITSFAAAFPMDRPRYALLVTIFDPRPEGGKAARSAGLTAAPAARAVIERVAPLLGVAPRPVSE